MMTWTRVGVCKEGPDSEAWFLLDPGAVEWIDEEEIPITEGFNFLKFPIGRARNIERDPDGRITAEVPEELIIRENERFPNGGEPMVYFGVYLTEIVQVKAVEKDDRFRVTHGRLRCLGRIPK